jgi:hypothetical protein
LRKAKAYSINKRKKIETGINRKLRMILKSELKTKNKITADGTSAVPVLRYSFGIINWRIEDTEKLTEKSERY